MEKLRQAKPGKREGTYDDKSIEHTQHMKRKEKESYIELHCAKKDRGNR